MTLMGQTKYRRFRGVGSAVGGLMLLSNNAMAFSPSSLVPTQSLGAEKLATKLSMQGNHKNQYETPSEDYQPANTFRPQRRDPQQPLRAMALDGDLRSDSLQEDPITEPASDSSLWQVLSAASLVTGSTVGAGMLILPSLAAGPGFAISTAMFLAVYALVLTSGLVIADVAINQHESGYEVPSSFQEFAEANLDNELVAKGVSAIPVAVNSLVLVFAISKAGDLLSSLSSSLPFQHMDPSMASLVFLAVLGACLSSLSGAQLSAVTSVSVTTLLLAFGGLLLPGLANVQDPMATLLAPGTAGEDWMASVCTATPIVLTALQFQNVVPTLTKILDYDRSKTVAAITLGSFLSLAMYLAWCFAALGGGVDAAGVACPLMTVFSAVTLFGSSLGAGMSVTEEVETFVTSSARTSRDSDETQMATKSSDSVFSPIAVLLSLAFPMAGVWFFSNDGNDASAALGVAGSFGSPLLYGIIPAMMALNQQRKTGNNGQANIKSLVPGGLASVGALGLAAAMYVGEGLASHVSAIISVAS